MMTLARAREFTLRAAKDSGLKGVEVIDAKWLGMVCEEIDIWKDTALKFRVAAVTVKDRRGRVAKKAVVLYSDGAVRVS